MSAIIRFKGGPGSGHHGHRGRPGLRGGSLPGKGGGAGAMSQRGRATATEVLPNQWLLYGFPVTPVETNTFEFLDFWLNDARVVELSADMSIHTQAAIFNNLNVRKGMKHSIVSDLSNRSGLPYEQVNKLVKSWALTSNDNHRDSLSMQQAASEEFGVKLSKWQLSKISEHGASSRLASREEERRYLRATYESTQEYLRKAGFKPGDKITLYRGYKVESATGRTPEPGDEVGYDGNAMESWSMMPYIASSFSVLETTDDTADVGYVIAADVPVERILSTAMTGFGCLREGEVVIFGGELGTVRVLDVVT